MNYSETNPFDFKMALNHALSRLTEGQRNDPVLRGKIENHLLRRVTAIVSGMMQYEEVEPLMQNMEKDPEMASEALNGYIASHPDTLDQLNKEMAHFESLISMNSLS